MVFVNGIFVIPKNSGGFRPIINLKVGKDMFREGDFLTKIDIRDAYLAVLIHPDRIFLHFRLKNSLYEFSCLYFGLASAPGLLLDLLGVSVAPFDCMHLKKCPIS